MFHHIVRIASPLALTVLLYGGSVLTPARAVAPADPPPVEHFAVPGHEAEMARLNELLDLHRVYTSGATPWDLWIPSAVVWPDVTAAPPMSAIHNQDRLNSYASIRATLETVDQIHHKMRKTLLERRIDADGYVSVQQHEGFGHSEGWPFPLWTQAQGMGWQFAVLGAFNKAFGVPLATTTQGWEFTGLRQADLDTTTGLTLSLDAGLATLTTPAFDVKALSAPFIRLQWVPDALPAGCKPYVQWATQDKPAFDDARRMEIATTGARFEGGYIYSMIPIFHSPAWQPEQRLTRLRLAFPDAAGARLVIKGLNTAVDTRHNVTNSSFVAGSVDFANWTGDLDFTREQLDRMRRAIRFCMSEFKTREAGVIDTPWVGHDGRSGLTPGPHGAKDKTVNTGLGVGNNYWDLIPFGGKDCLATIYYYHAVNQLAGLEEMARRHPEYQLPLGELSFDPAELRRHAADVKARGNALFWNKETGRFVSAVDVTGKAWDFGFTFVNLEAVAYGFATPEHAKSILEWVDGRRNVAGDTSRGADIYHWRFAPRATTRRNVEYYTFAWTGPETIDFGVQVQDGGAVLGWSYFDLLARLDTLGPDSACARLGEILKWFDEVQREGGYSAYYAKPGRGRMQGGTHGMGGLGMDCEFIESVLVPQVMLYGFLGFEPRLDGLTLNPRLPAAWPSLKVSKIRYHDLDLTIEAGKDKITIQCAGQPARPLSVRVPWSETATPLRPGTITITR